MAINDGYVHACFPPGTQLYYFRLIPSRHKVRVWIAHELKVKKDPGGRENPPDVMYLGDEKPEIVGLFDDDFEQTGEFVLRVNPEDDGRVAEAEVIANVIRIVNLRPRK